MGKTIRIGVVEVGADPRIESVPADDDARFGDALREVVGGYLETVDAVSDDPDVTLYVNEEGILMGLEPNRAVYATPRMAEAGLLSQVDYARPVREGDLYTVLFGDFVIVAHDAEGAPRNLSDEEFHAVADRFFGEESRASGNAELDRVGRKRTRDSLPKEVTLLTTEDESAEKMSEQASDAGLNVVGTTVWKGVVPPDSYMNIAPDVRMSTPEFYLMRKLNQLGEPLATLTAIEMLGKYRTHLTCPSVPPETYEFLHDTRTTVSRMRSYLAPVRWSTEARVASEAIDRVPVEASTPLQGWLVTALCTPVENGGYGLPTPVASAVFEGPHDRVCPGAQGKYLAYDLFWENLRVAVQYTGPEAPSGADADALSAGGLVDVTAVTDADLADPESALAAIAGKVTGRKVTPRPGAAHDELMALAPKPKGMVMTYAELASRMA